MIRTGSEVTVGPSLVALLALGVLAYPVLAGTWARYEFTSDSDTIQWVPLAFTPLVVTDPERCKQIQQPGALPLLIDTPGAEWICGCAIPNRMGDLAAQIPSRENSDGTTSFLCHTAVLTTISTKDGK